MGLSIPRQTSTRTDRIPSHHQGRRIVQLRIFVCMLLSWEARQLPPLSAASELDIDGEGCDQLVSAGLCGSGHDGYEVGSGDVDFVDDAVAVGLNRRKPTWW